MQTCEQELKEHKSALQQQHAQVRKWANERQGASKELKSKLGAVRVRIEQKLRSLQKLEKEIGLHMEHTEARPQQAPPSSQESSPRAGADEVKVMSCQLLENSDMNQEMICKICLDVVGNDPKLTRCSHLFCGDCISQWCAAQPGNQTWAQRAKMNGRVPCPVCKEQLHEDRDLYSVQKGGNGGSAFLWKMLMQTTLDFSPAVVPIDMLACGFDFSTRPAQSA